MAALHFGSGVRPDGLGGASEDYEEEAAEESLSGTLQTSHSTTAFRQDPLTNRFQTGDGLSGRVMKNIYAESEMTIRVPRDSSHGLRYRRTREGVALFEVAAFDTAAEPANPLLGTP